VGTATLRFTWHPRKHSANKPSLSFCRRTIRCTRKGHLNKPGSVYGLKVLAVVLFQTRDVQKEVHKLFDSIPDNLRKQKSNISTELNTNLIIIHTDLAQGCNDVC
jgi:hypothetical protein